MYPSHPGKKEQESSQCVCALTFAGQGLLLLLLQLDLPPALHLSRLPVISIIVVLRVGQQVIAQHSRAGQAHQACCTRLVQR